MSSQRWMSWAGMAAIVGGLAAIGLTPVFATAYFLAYPGEDVLPFWFPMMGSHRDSLLAFSSPTDVYDTYGRIFDVVYVLFYRRRSHSIGSIGDPGVEQRGVLSSSSWSDSAQPSSVSPGTTGRTE